MDEDAIYRFFKFVENDNFEGVSQFLRANPYYDVNLSDPEQFYVGIPITIAIKEGRNTKIVELLLKCGADPNIRVEVSHNSLLVCNVLICSYDTTDPQFRRIFPH